MKHKSGLDLALVLEAAAQQYLDDADRLSANLEKWTVTTSGELLAEVSYVRINPADPDKPNTYQSPDDSWIDIKNGGGRHPAKNIVDGGFLERVRYGFLPTRRILSYTKSKQMVAGPLPIQS
jgi:GH15 family glucan-1,4-alpha-glucosidase